MQPTLYALQQDSDATLDEAAVLETWLTEVGKAPALPAWSIAQAMQQDGFETHQAHALAAAAVLRHDASPLAGMATAQRLEEAALSLAQHFRQARRNAADDAQAPSLPRYDANTLRLADGRIVDIRLRCSAPELVMFDGVLDPDECQGLIDMARDRLRASHVMDVDHGVVDADVRSSTGTSLAPGTHALLDRVEARLADLLDWPLAHTEELEVVRYGPDQKFSSHLDYFDRPDLPLHQRELQSAGQRVGTLVVYLSDVPRGGGTAFDALGLEVRPRRGSAVYFAYRLPDGRMDAASLHQGLAVHEGEKWVATLWLRERRCRHPA